MEKVTAKDVYDAAAAGDENAKRVTEEAGTALGVAAAILGCVVNPEVILLGGGVSAASRASSQLWMQGARWSEMASLTPRQFLSITMSFFTDPVMVGEG